jgi:hypothetical protein
MFAEMPKQSLAKAPWHRWSPRRNLRVVRLAACLPAARQIAWNTPVLR